MRCLISDNKIIQQTCDNVAGLLYIPDIDGWALIMDESYTLP